MDQITSVHQTITKLKRLPVELPSELNHAIKLYQSVAAPEEPGLPDWSQVSVDQLSELYVDYLNELLASTVVDAKQNYFVTSLASYVIRTANRSHNEIVDKLRPMFDAAAERYTAAVEKLPGEISDSSLVQAGPDALKAYQDAQAAAAEISAYTGFVGKVEGNEGIVLRATLPTDYGQIQQLTSARNNTTPSLTKVDPVLFTAAKHGIALELHTENEQQQIQDELLEKFRAANKQRPGMKFHR